jgi:hypothetical protein
MNQQNVLKSSITNRKITTNLLLKLLTFATDFLKVFKYEKEKL